MSHLKKKLKIYILRIRAISLQFLFNIQITTHQPPQFKSLGPHHLKIVPKLISLQLQTSSSSCWNHSNSSSKFAVPQHPWSYYEVANAYQCLAAMDFWSSPCYECCCSLTGSLYVAVMFWQLEQQRTSQSDYVHEGLVYDWSGRGL